MRNAEYRYLKNAEDFLNDISKVWSRHLQSDKAIRELFDAIATNEEKDLFLRIGAFYRYLVVEGSFQFAKKEWNDGMSYIDDTYKYVAIFSLIEALETAPVFKDFFQWVQGKKTTPIPLNKSPMSVLSNMYQDYKSKYGSTKAAIRFFERLDLDDQALIENKLKVRGKNLSIKKLSQLLYDLRSKFVHEGRFILGFGSSTTISNYKSSTLTNKFTMDDLRSLFERGFLKRFGWTKNTQPGSSVDSKGRAVLEC